MRNGNSRLWRTATSTAIAGLAACVAAAASTTVPPALAAIGECPSSPAQRTTVQYASHTGWDPNLNRLDVYRPADACDAPVVMWIHGGGYQRGDKRARIADKAALFNSRGWILVSANYRLTRPGSTPSARYPVHFEDVADAVAWVEGSIAAFGGDPSRIALLGHSAGADIVSNVVTDPRYLARSGLRADSAITCAGPLDTEGFDKPRSTSGQLQWQLALGNLPTYLTDTSATLLLRPGVPPMIGVFRGTANRQSIERAFLDRVRAVGSPATAIDARSLTHEQVNAQIGAPGDTVMTPPLMTFLSDCLAMPPPAKRKKVHISVKASHRRTRLHVGIKPDLRGHEQWAFRIQQRRTGSWHTTSDCYRTRGRNQTRTVQIPHGKYRVRVGAAHHRRGATSRPVRIRE